MELSPPNQLIQSQSALTQSQLLLWIGQEMNPQSPMYNMVLTFELEGKIKTEHFKAAFQELINKSDTLRTVFEVHDGKPVQKILKQLAYEIEVLDFSNHLEADITYEHWAKERTQRIFDLSKCLFDSILVRFSETHFIWYFNQHHLTTDAWSTSVIYKEMARLYKLSLEGRLAEAPQLLAFRDYIELPAEMCHVNFGQR